MLSQSASKDHPRSRGVYPKMFFTALKTPGSSPLARGLRRARRWGSRASGIIPARAGFTCPQGDNQFRGADHPRSRGVYPTSRDRICLRRGSSPLARGLHPDCEGPGYGDGIIPARAGFTASSRSRRAAFTDHPRSRGVYSRPLACCFLIAGSSPLARGLLTITTDEVPNDRIIPARAGFTRPAPAGSSACWDHPRSRGVYERRTGMSTGLAGSSPLARGLRVRVRGPVQGRGIIPARAGFTARKPARAGPAGDHPRSRGVYSSAPSAAGGSGGSSPLARGLRSAHARSSRLPRIIPARAGFTRVKSLWAASLRGSSPLARGLL